MTDTKPVNDRDHIADAKRFFNNALFVRKESGTRPHSEYTSNIFQSEAAATISIAESLAALVAAKTADKQPAQDPLEAQGNAEADRLIGEFVTAVFGPVPWEQAPSADEDEPAEEALEWHQVAESTTAFALLSGVVDSEAGTEIRLTLSPADLQKILDWNLAGGLTLSPGAIVRV